MKRRRVAIGVMMAILLALSNGHSLAGISGGRSPAPAEESVKAYLGRWDLTLMSPDREYPSWLEVSEEGGSLKARMVGRWGHAHELRKVEFAKGKLTFASPKEEEETSADITFEGELAGNALTGTVDGLTGGVWHWTGTRAPVLKENPSPKWGKAIALFNGKDLTGWKPSGPSKVAWNVENGLLVSPGRGPELISIAKFNDFKLHVEFNCGPNSNSGVYLRGRYEVQIETDSPNEPADQRIGGVYGFLAPNPELPRKTGEWQSFDITLLGRWVTIVQDGKTIVDRREIPGITGGALESHEGLPGPVYLQGSEDGHVSFRSIVITPAEK